MTAAPTPRRFRPLSAAAAALVLVVVAFPVAERICDLDCRALPVAGESPARACPAHPAAPESPRPDDRADPCGHAHAGDGVLLAASASTGKNGPRSLAPPATLSAPLSPLPARLPLCRDDFLRLPAPSRPRPGPSVLRL